jgi:hypothetical protein
LLSLQHILDWAIEELIAIRQDDLTPLQGSTAWTDHMMSLEDIVDSYRFSIKVFRDKLQQTSSAAIHAVL